MLTNFSPFAYVTVNKVIYEHNFFANIVLTVNGHI